MSEKIRKWILNIITFVIILVIEAAIVIYPAALTLRIQETIELRWYGVVWFWYAIVSSVLNAGVILVWFLSWIFKLDENEENSDEDDTNHENDAKNEN